MTTAVEPKEGRIIFGSQMICALLEGKKFQTRRCIKPQPDWATRQWTSEHITQAWNAGFIPVKCPYATPGMRLRVRETWFLAHKNTWDAPKVVHPDGERAAYFRAGWDRIHPRWRPSIHMPRWASRIVLEITDIQVERVQEISDGDVAAEGTPGMIAGRYQCEPCNGRGSNITWPKGCPHCKGTGNDPQSHFNELWDSINKKRGFGWQTNPFVWVISFKRVNE